MMVQVVGGRCEDAWGPLRSGKTIALSPNRPHLRHPQTRLIQYHDLGHTIKRKPFLPHFFRFRIYRFWVVGWQNIEPWLESRVLKETVTLWPKTCIAAVDVVPC